MLTRNSKIKSFKNRKEQTMSDDLIKRSDAIRTVCECECYSGDNPCEEGKGCYAVNELRKLPSADRPQEWIPCSERLPEDVQIGDEYPTVIFCTKENTYAGFYEYYLGGRWWAEDGDYVVDDVIAWMPLPKPWKGADDE